MKIITKQIPNFITALNLVAGALATYFAIEGHLIWAGIFICIAAIFDFLDGLAARVLRAYSDIGAQLDSLADVISFGLAPGAIAFTLVEFSLFKINRPIYEITANWHEWLLLFLSFLLPVFAALRLARFNIAEKTKSYFKGLAVPSNGIFWASMGIMIEKPVLESLQNALYNTKVLAIFILLFAGLMVSNLPMFSFKISNFSLKQNWYRYLFLLIATILLLAFNFTGLMLCILCYILLNIILYLAGVALKD